MSKPRKRATHLWHVVCFTFRLHAKRARSQTPRDLRPISHFPKTMRCLTSSEIHKWLAGQGMHHQPLDSGVPEAGDFPIPTERRARMHLASYLADLLAKDGNKLVEIIPAPNARPTEWEQMTASATSQRNADPTSPLPVTFSKAATARSSDGCSPCCSDFALDGPVYIYSAPRTRRCSSTTASNLVAEKRHAQRTRPATHPRRRMRLDDETLSRRMLLPLTFPRSRHVRVR